MMIKQFKEYLVCLLVGLLAFNSLKGQTALVGMTSKGGSYGMGSLFSIIPGDTSLLQNFSFFSATPGSEPDYTSCIEAANGKLYGVTPLGGIHNKGVIFEYDYATNSYNRKHDFNGIDGSYPSGALIEVSPGKLYGMAHENGLPGYGSIYEYDYITNTFTIKFDMNGSNGIYPYGSLIKASNNKLYGMNSGGGAYGKGVLFEYDYLTGIFTKLMDFDGINGAGGIGSLMQSSNGKLYGMTLEGGVSNKGVIFEYDYIINNYTKIFDFDGGNGSNPYGALLEASNGKFYGMTSLGGWFNKGVFFEYDYVTNIVSIKKDFQLSTGGIPTGSMIEVNNKLYGLTSDGGNLNKGSLFEYDFVTDTYTKKADLTGSNGNAPLGSLVKAGNGLLYGLASAGGSYGQGVVFEYNIATNVFVKKISFNSSNGRSPYGSLMQLGNGKLYGMTAEGGTADNGVIFEYDFNTGTYTKKLDINTCLGATPNSSLIEAPNGKFYGVSFYGGTYNEGTFFEYDSSSNSCTKLNDFGGNDGRFPNGSPVLAANGKIYGITGTGGSSAGCGVIYEYDYQTGTFTIKMNLTSGPGGCGSYSDLVEANGKLYGMTRSDGAFNWGVLFEYDYLSNIYQKKIDFDNNNGALPHGSLMKATNGKLYGMTPYGGLYSKGVLFEYDCVSNFLVTKFDFDGANGKYPFGSLMQASNGKLYGMTREGGAFDQGALFEYDYSFNTFITKMSFSDSIGSFPEYGHLIEINLSNVGINNTTPVFEPLIYPNPTNEKVVIEFSLNNNRGNMEIRLTDVSGREVMRKKIEVINGFNQLEVDLSPFQAGMYLLYFIDAKGSRSVNKIALK